MNQEKAKQIITGMGFNHSRAVNNLLESIPRPEVLPNAITPAKARALARQLKMNTSDT